MVKILKQVPRAVTTPIGALLALILMNSDDFEDVSKGDSLFCFAFHFQHVLKRGSMKISLASQVLRLNGDGDNDSYIQPMPFPYLFL